MKTPSDLNPPLTGLIDVTLQLFLIGSKLCENMGLTEKFVKTFGGKFVTYH